MTLSPEERNPEMFNLHKYNYQEAQHIIKTIGDPRLSYKPGETTEYFLITDANAGVVRHVPNRKSDDILEILKGELERFDKDLEAYREGEEVEPVEEMVDQ